MALNLTVFLSQSVFWFHTESTESTEARIVARAWGLRMNALSTDCTDYTVSLSRSVVRSHTEGTEYTDFCKSLRPCWHTSRWFFFPRMSRINTVLRTRVACAGLWDVTIALREKKQFKFCIDSVDNYVIFACCARGVTLSELMLHSLAIVLITALSSLAALVG